MSFRRLFGAQEDADYKSLAIAAAHFGDAADYPFGIQGHIQFFKFLVAVAAIITRLMCGSPKYFRM